MEADGLDIVIVLDDLEVDGVVIVLVRDRAERHVDLLDHAGGQDDHLGEVEGKEPGWDVRVGEVDGVNSSILCSQPSYAAMLLLLFIPVPLCRHPLPYALHNHAASTVVHTVLPAAYT